MTRVAGPGADANHAPMPFPSAQPPIVIATNDETLHGNTEAAHVGAANSTRPSTRYSTEAMRMAARVFGASTREG